MGAWIAVGFYSNVDFVGCDVSWLKAFLDMICIYYINIFFFLVGILLEQFLFDICGSKHFACLRIFLQHLIVLTFNKSNSPPVLKFQTLPLFAVVAVHKVARATFDDINDIYANIMFPSNLDWLERSDVRVLSPSALGQVPHVHGAAGSGFANDSSPSTSKIAS